MKKNEKQAKLTQNLRKEATSKDLKEYFSKEKKKADFEGYQDSWFRKCRRPFGW